MPFGKWSSCSPDNKKDPICRGTGSLFNESAMSWLEHPQGSQQSLHPQPRLGWFYQFFQFIPVHLQTQFVGFTVLRKIIAFYRSRRGRNTVSIESENNQTAHIPRKQAWNQWNPKKTKSLEDEWLSGWSHFIWPFLLGGGLPFHPISSHARRPPIVRTSGVPFSTPHRPLLGRRHRRGSERMEGEGVYQISDSPHVAKMRWSGPRSYLDDEIDEWMLGVAGSHVCFFFGGVKTHTLWLTSWIGKNFLTDELFWKTWKSQA